MLMKPLGPTHKFLLLHEVLAINLHSSEHDKCWARHFSSLVGATEVIRNILLPILPVSHERFLCNLTRQTLNGIVEARLV